MAPGIVYCPRCKSIMVPLRGRRNRSSGRVKLVCKNCGYTTEVDGSQLGEAYRFNVKVEKSPRDKILVVTGGQLPPGAEILKGNVRCPNCGYDEVIFWLMQARSADEPMTRFYRCRRCGHTWREYA